MYDLQARLSEKLDATTEFERDGLTVRKTLTISAAGVNVLVEASRSPLYYEDHPAQSKAFAHGDYIAAMEWAAGAVEDCVRLCKS